MIKWEYHTIVVPYESSDEWDGDKWDYLIEIEELGLKGWELVSVNTIPAVTDEDRHLERLTFKRPAGRVWFGMLHT